MGATLRTRFNRAAMLAMLLLMAGCAGLPAGMQPPAVTIADFGIGNAGLFEQQFNLRLRVQNPNPDELRIDGIAFDIDVNGQPFAKGVGNQNVVVPRYGSDFMTAEAVSTLGGLLRQFGRVTEGKFKYRIKGVLSIGGTRQPFEETGEFDVKGLVPKGLVQ